MTPRHIFREDGVSSGEHAVTGSGNVDEFVLVFERIRSERELLLQKTYCSKLENKIADGRVRRVGAARLLIHTLFLSCTEGARLELAQPYGIHSS